MLFLPNTVVLIYINENIVSLPDTAVHAEHRTRMKSAATILTASGTIPRTSSARYLTICSLQTTAKNEKCVISRVISKIKKPVDAESTGFFDGAPCWARTNDPAVNSRMLYH